jgi:hypothetical protein
LALVFEGFFRAAEISAGVWIPQIETTDSISVPKYREVKYTGVVERLQIPGAVIDVRMVVFEFSDGSRRYVCPDARIAVCKEHFD